MSLSQILAELPKLSAADLLQVKMRVDLLMPTTLGSKGSDDWLTPGFLWELKRRGLAFPPDWRKYAPAGYDALNRRIQEGLLEAGVRGARVSDAFKYALGRVIARALADYLEKAGVPLGLKPMLNGIVTVPTAVERSFPGYLQAGKLGFLVGRTDDV